MLTAFNESIGGEIYVKKIPSMKVVDVASAILGHENIDVIGVRLGEKIHEQMISSEDSLTTYSYDGYYKILPSINNWHKDKARIKEGIKVDEGFVYSSDNNDQWMTKDELLNFLKRINISNMIPYGKQNISKEDIDQVKSVLKSDFLNKVLVPKFEKEVRDKYGANFSYAFNSATSALHIACLSL